LLKKKISKKEIFKDNKKMIEEFFRSNVDNMLEDRKIRVDQERKEELEIITRKAERKFVMKWIHMN
jgi:hypothetical protein